MSRKPWIKPLSHLLAIGAIVYSGAATIHAAKAEWKDKNEQINQTNFIMTTQSYAQPFCSATLISLKYKLVITADHCVEEYIDTKTVQRKDDTGEVKQVEVETMTDARLAQKAYQGHQLVGDASYQAKIIVHEKKMDMALMQIRADKLPHTVYSHVLPEGKKVERGDRVWVVGNPLGMLDASLTSGVVSSTTRMYEAPWADMEEVPFIQTDASINGGNSGGALYNDDGEFIGIPDAGWRGANGLGLTLTPESVRAFLDKNCFAEVYDDKKSRHECIEEKRKQENARREKKGLPALKNDEGPQEN